MKNLIFFIILFFFSIAMSLQGQDTIYFKNNEKAIAIISEITENKIRYKEYSLPDGPDFYYSLEYINKVVFKNGQTKVYAKSQPVIPFKRNVIAFHIFDLVYKDFSFSYEHIVKNGKYGIKIPIGIGINPSSGYDGPREYLNVFYSGVGFNIYVMGQRMASYFMGPEIHFGSGMDNVDYWDDENGYHIDKDEQFFYGRFLINNGIAFTPIPNFRLTGVAGLGVRYYDLYNGYDDGVRPTFYFTFSMGYRF